MRMLGHVLRLDRNAPAQVAMDLYLSEGRRKRGRPQTCLASTVARDLRDLGLRFRTSTDLRELRETASDRKAWRVLVRTLAPDDLFNQQDP